MLVRKLREATAVGRAPALLARVREKRNRGLRADQDHLLDARQRLDDLLGEVGQALDRNAAGTEFAVGRERVRQQSGPGLRRDPAGGLEARAAQRPATQQDRGLAAVAQQFCAFVDGIRGCGMRADGWQWSCGVMRIAPGRVRRQDERRDASGRRGGRLHGPCGIRGYATRALRLAEPRRNRSREPDEIRGERRVVLQMVGGMVADDVDDRCRGASRVVQVGETVREPGPQVQQRARRLAGHAAVAVGGAGRDAFEKAQDGTHPGDRVDRRDEMHLRCARVAEADLDSAVDERLYEGLCTVHLQLLARAIRRRPAVIIGRLRMEIQRAIVATPAARPYTDSMLFLALIPERGR